LKKLKLKQDNILVIPDLHAPFTAAGFLNFCRYYQQMFYCGTVVFLGDLIDNHFSSFHDTDPDADHAAGQELEAAIETIEGYYRAFPVAKVVLGNHDKIPARKTFNSGVSKRWLKSIGEVLQTPGWEYSITHVVYNILVHHGKGQNALKRCEDMGQSVVQGHHHSQSSINYTGNGIFSLQVGCGIDRDSYAFAYGEDTKKQKLNLGIVLDAAANPIPLLVKYVREEWEK